MTEFDKNVLEQIMKELWKNWAFRLSLSSNELFHSNVLQYLVETSATPLSDMPLKSSPGLGEDTECSAASSGIVPSGDKSGDGSEPTVIDRAGAVRLLEVLCGIGNERCKPAFDLLTNAPKDASFLVQREWNHMDLAVLIQSGKKRLPIFALEVKVKAYPEPEQLKRYRDVLDAKWKQRNKKCDSKYDPPLFLLTGMGHHVTKDSPNTYALSFDNLAEGLRENVDLDNPVAGEYVKLCELLHLLFTNLEEELLAAPTWERTVKIADTMEPYRLHSLWWKLWAAFVAKQCRERIADTTTYLDIYSGYTRTGNLGVCWKWQDVPKRPSKSISVGVQIEGNSVRLCLTIVHASLGFPLQARQRVEAVLLKLMTGAGVFASNPGMHVLLERWGANSQKSFSNGSEFPLTDLTAASLSLGPTASELFTGEVGEGQIDGGFIPMLTGYANGQGNGFADVRLTLQAGSTIEAVAQMVWGVLCVNLFSTSQSVEGQDPLLLRVVKGFKEETDTAKWLQTPIPT